MRSCQTSNIINIAIGYKFPSPLFSVTKHIPKSYKIFFNSQYSLWTQRIQTPIVAIKDPHTLNVINPGETFNNTFFSNMRLMFFIFIFPHIIN